MKQSIKSLVLEMNYNINNSDEHNEPRFNKNGLLEEYIFFPLNDIYFNIDLYTNIILYNNLLYLPHVSYLKNDSLVDRD